MRPPLITALLALAACGHSPGVSGEPDAGGDGNDGGELSAGLRVEIESSPAIPGAWENSFEPTLDACEIVLHDFRVVGDADPERTRVGEVQLTWESEPVEVVALADAPIGRYSRIRASVDSILLSGTLQLDGETESWEIGDEPPSSVDVDLEIAVDLEPGEIETIGLTVELQPLFEAIDWDTIAEDDGVFSVDDDSDEIDAVREALDAAVTLSD